MLALCGVAQGSTIGLALKRLKNDRAALNGSKEVIKGVEDALKGDKKWLKGDEEEVKGSGICIIVLLYLYTCQSRYLPVYFI